VSSNQDFQFSKAVLSLANYPQDVGDYLDADAYSPQSRLLMKIVLLESQFARLTGHRSRLVEIQSARLTGHRPRLLVEFLVEILVAIQFARLTSRVSSKRARNVPQVFAFDSSFTPYDGYAASRPCFCRSR
jgi:hypothetical protein